MLFKMERLFANMTQCMIKNFPSASKECTSLYLSRTFAIIDFCDGSSNLRYIVWNLLAIHCENMRKVKEANIYIN